MTREQAIQAAGFVVGRFIICRDTAINDYSDMHETIKELAVYIQPDVNPLKLDMECAYCVRMMVDIIISWHSREALK